MEGKPIIASQNLLIGVKCLLLVLVAHHRVFQQHSSLPPQDQQLVELYNQLLVIFNLLVDMLQVTQDEWILEQVSILIDDLIKKYEGL